MGRVRGRAARAAELGVRRISVGGTLARTAWAGCLAAAEDDRGERSKRTRRVQRVVELRGQLRRA